LFGWIGDHYIGDRTADVALLIPGSGAAVVAGAIPGIGIAGGRRQGVIGRADHSRSGSRANRDAGRIGRTMAIAIPAAVLDVHVDIIAGHHIAGVDVAAADIAVVDVAIVDHAGVAVATSIGSRAGVAASIAAAGNAGIARLVLDVGTI